MASSQDIDRFLADLDGRRTRLLRLVPADEGSRTELFHELEELAEQLVVADEELRVQQEELEETSRKVEMLARDSHALLLVSSDAQVVTDLRGVVRESNRVADQLVLRPGARLLPRPIATWFDVSHRSHVRSLISEMVAGAAELTLRAVLLHRSDGSSVPVSVTVHRAVDPGSHNDVLRWQLRRVTGASALRPTLVEAFDPDDVTQVTNMTQLLAETGELAGRLALARTADEVAGAIAAAARQMVPGVTEALLGPTDSPAPASAHEFRVPVLPTGYLPAELLVLAPDPFDAGARGVVSALAALAAGALTRIVTEEQLRRGLEHRQLIGQAVGILVERHRLTPDAAFEALTQASSRHNVKVRHIAEIMVETGQDLADIVGR